MKFQLFLKIYFSNIIILFLHAAESQNMTRQISTYLPKHFHINPETRMNTQYLFNYTECTCINQVFTVTPNIIKVISVLSCYRVFAFAVIVLQHCGSEFAKNVVIEYSIYQIRTENIFQHTVYMYLLSIQLNLGMALFMNHFINQMMGPHVLFHAITQSIPLT